MTKKPANKSVPAKPAPKLPTRNAKPHQSAAGLLGRTGSGGLGPINPLKSMPTASDAPTKTQKHANFSEPVASAKHTGKAETRRPTGRAISGS